MDPGAINSFLDQFLALADGGFGLIRGDVTYVLNALIVISIALAGAQWALAAEAPMAPFFRKVLFIGFFAFLINNWGGLATAINQSGAMLGLRAGGSSLTLADLSNPGRVAQIGGDLFGRTVALGEGMNILTDFIPLATIFLAGLMVMLGFFLLALQLFVTMITFKLGALAAFVALPWGVFSGTAWVAERPLGWVVGCAIRLFVLAFIASVSITFVDALPATLTLDAGGALNVLLFGATVMALAWFGPALASEVVSGQPHLAGPDAMRAGVGAAITTVAFGAGGAYAGAGAIKLGGQAFKSLGAALGGASSSGRRGGGSSSAGKPPAAINYAGMQPKPSSPPPPPATGGGTGGKP
ncbi:MAG: trbL [Alphaproteobacteria bacterium]|nr:MAG: trbL [Caulobacteraceae bacterium]TPW07417.1 MAG: trbL [Alphaproteobacteria bacterium]